MAKNSAKNIKHLIEAAKTETPIEQQFLADLIFTIEQDALERSYKPSRAYHPSSMMCVRNMYYQIIGAEPDSAHRPYSLIGMGQSGGSRHDEIQRLISRMHEFGIDCEYLNVRDYIEEKKLTNLEVRRQDGFETLMYHKGLNMSFKTDGLVRYKNFTTGFEYKTEAQDKFMVRQGVDPAHVPQGTSYACAFELDDVLFLYENRSLCLLKAYMLHVTPEMKQDLVLTPIEECDGYVARQVAPPKPEGISKKTCQYCNYRKRCKETR